ncbi:HNH endonuclease domain-containing protein [Rhodococcus tukisamuensis]|uniref:HNH endonuclease n=1 Tax=Rhodococcus tukisamuensis TaxID=168276 RepID=A0A1G7B080_9NOCA|nr:HNH endonuclease domain-containing protein [Rhodococcus tukisamuensis]SDE20330.1 HNH endonuclease [Rhodococcus tukisamuensis]
MAELSAHGPIVLRPGVARAFRDLAPLLRPMVEMLWVADRPITTGGHVDHVLPWSKVPIDGVANLVLADERCNLDKLASLPVFEHVTRATTRPRDDLVEVSRRARFPVLLDRTRRAAGGLYGALPPGSPLWRAVKQFEAHR